MTKWRGSRRRSGATIGDRARGRGGACRRGADLCVAAAVRRRDAGAGAIHGRAGGRARKRDRRPSRDRVRPRHGETLGRRLRIPQGVVHTLRAGGAAISRRGARSGICWFPTVGGAAIGARRTRGRSVSRCGGSSDPSIPRDPAVVRRVWAASRTRSRVLLVVRQVSQGYVRHLRGGDRCPGVAVLCELRRLARSVATPASGARFVPTLSGSRTSESGRALSSGSQRVVACRARY